MPDDFMATTKTIKHRLILPHDSPVFIPATVMSFATTFGSVGDFITVCQIAAQLNKVLGNGYGASSTEYQSLRKELDDFAQVVTYVSGIIPVLSLMTDTLADRVFPHAAGVPLD